MSTTQPNRSQQSQPRQDRPIKIGSMGQPVERDSTSGESFRRLLGYLRPYRIRLLGCGVLVITATLLGLVGPWLQGVAIDNYIAEQDRPGLRNIVILLAVIYLVAWLTALVYSRVIARVTQRAMAQIRQDLFKRLQTLSIRFFDRNKTGDLMSRVTNDVDAVDQLLSQNLLGITNSAAQLIGLGTIMLVLDWRLTLAAILPVPIVLTILRRIGAASRPAFQEYQKSVGEVNAVAQERISGQRAVISFDRQDQARAEFDKVNEATRARGIKAQTLTVLMMPLMFGLGNLGTVSVVGFGAWLAVSGDGNGVTVGLIASFVAYASRIGRPLANIGNTVTSLFAALGGATRVFELLDETPDVVDKADAVELEPVQGRVVFEDVHFSYTEGEKVLADINFVAEPGQTIGLVGPTGAGKSTLINVLNRFYDIESGSVTIDGHDIRNVQQNSLRDQLGIVLQRTFLFTDTVRENIRFGRLSATDEEVEEAAKLANAHHFIQALPHSYDTIISEGGTNLSLGQRQLIAIARAALAEPRLLVLDEATSSVDTRTERAIQSALIKLMDGRTSFVIAHRLSTVRDADQILVIQDGKITEHGTHTQLLGVDGLYKHLYLTQFRDHTPTSATS